MLCGCFIFLFFLRLFHAKRNGMEIYIKTIVSIQPLLISAKQHHSVQFKKWPFLRKLLRVLLACQPENSKILVCWQCHWLSLHVCMLHFYESLCCNIQSLKWALMHLQRGELSHEQTHSQSAKGSKRLLNKLFRAVKPSFGNSHELQIKVCHSHHSHTLSWISTCDQLNSSALTVFFQVHNSRLHVTRNP